MRKFNFSILVLILATQNLAMAALNFDKRCAKEVPYISTWPEIKASYDVGRDVDGAPFELPNGDIVVGTDVNAIYLFDKDLKYKDYFSTNKVVNNGFEMFDKYTAITYTTDGTAVYYSTKSGARLGNSAGYAVYNQTPARLSDGTIVVGTDIGVAINRNGTITTSHTGSGCHSSPAVMIDDTFVVGCNDGKVNYFSPAGELIYSFSTGSTGKKQFKAPMILPSGNVAIGSYDGYFYILSPDAKLVAKSQNYGPITSNPNMSDENTIVVGTEGGLVLFLDARTLAEKMRFPKQGKIDAIYSGVSILPIAGGHKLLVFPSWDKNVYFLSTKGELVGKVLLDAQSKTTPTVTSAGNILVGNRGHKIYLIELKSEKRVRRVAVNECSGSNSQVEVAEEEPVINKTEEMSPQTPKNQDRFD